MTFDAVVSRRVRKFEPQSIERRGNLFNSRARRSLCVMNIKKINCFIYPKRLQHSKRRRRILECWRLTWWKGEANGDVVVECLLIRQTPNKHARWKGGERARREQLLRFERFMDFLLNENFFLFYFQTIKLHKNSFSKPKIRSFHLKICRPPRDVE